MKITKLLILFLLLSLKGFSQQAQCVSVKKVNGNEVRTNIPCNFPISTSEIVSFSEALNTWYTNNPKLIAVVLTPNSSPSNNSIEIPFSVYNQFSDAKKKAVNGIPYFYKIINNN